MKKREVQSLTTKGFFRQLFSGTEPGIFIVGAILLMVAILICVAGMRLEGPKENTLSKTYIGHVKNLLAEK